MKNVHLVLHVPCGGFDLRRQVRQKARDSIRLIADLHFDLRNVGSLARSRAAALKAQVHMLMRAISSTTEIM